MNEFDLERYRTAWQGGKNFGHPPLDPDEIEAQLKKESNNITRQFRVGIVVDMVLKGVATVALAGLLFLFRGNPVVTWLNAAVLAITLLLLFFQRKVLRDIPRPETAGNSLRGCLEEMIRYYRKRFVAALYVAAASGSLVFYIGVLYYSWFKYGGIRPMEVDDWVVFLTGLLLAFAINATAQRWQTAFHVRELEFCLKEIDADSLSEQKLRQQRFRRIRISLMWAVWLVLGVLVLTWFIAR